MSPPKLGIADTTFARVDMGQVVLDRVEAYLQEHDQQLETVRRTVPGIKDLPTCAKRLISLEDCDLVLALGQVGPEEIDKQCAHEASLGIQQAQLATDTHVLEVFVHSDEADQAGRLRWLAENRAREHAVNAMWMLFEPAKMRELAGTGQREGYQDEGPIEARSNPPKEGPA